MKKIVLTIAIALLIGIAGATAQTTIQQNGKNFTEVATTKQGAGYSKTDYTYTTKKGETYPIYLHTTTRGKNAGTERCYIQRVSKETKKPYWQAIDVDPAQVKEERTRTYYERPTE